MLTSKERAEKAFNDMQRYAAKTVADLTAEQVIKLIASESFELSYDKIRVQRDEIILYCREWLNKESTKSETDKDLTCICSDLPTDSNGCPRCMF